MSSSLTKRASLLALLASLALATTACLGLPSANETTEVTVTVTAEPDSQGGINDGGDTDGQSATEVALDEYVAASQAQLPELIAQNADTFAEIGIYAEYPSTVEYAYLYVEQIDGAAAAAQFDEQIPTFQDAVNTSLIPEMVAYGIVDNPTVRYTYYNADGSLIWTQTFSQS